MPEKTTVKEFSLSQEIISMCNSTRTMLELTWKGFRKMANTRDSASANKRLGRDERARM